MGKAYKSRIETQRHPRSSHPTPTLVVPMIRSNNSSKLSDSNRSPFLGNPSRCHEATTWLRSLYIRIESMHSYCIYTGIATHALIHYSSSLNTFANNAALSNTHTKMCIYLTFVLSLVFGNALNLTVTFVSRGTAQ